MGDGGKGSGPRPYSVSQEQFSNNWDAIFSNKNKDWRFQEGCGCYKCQDTIIVPGTMMPVTMGKFIVCPQCGNKRCPRGTDHTLACTNSNEPGQAGSRY
jgi:hypothetical protein